VPACDGRTDGFTIANTALCIDAVKMDKILQKARNLLVHIVELSTAVAEVDIKVINGSLTQNQCLQCVAPSLMRV